MLRIIFVSILAVLLTSCGGQDSTDLKKKITNKEELISKLTSELQPGEQLDVEERVELIRLLNEYYHTFPDDVYAPECLDKLHMMYSGSGDYETSVKYADTLLSEYPDYINRAMILESQASSYDIYIQPRDTAKVRFYYELLLNEFPDLDKEKREGIESRLDRLHLSIEQIIMQNN